jgi:hypothetical protein
MQNHPNPANNPPLSRPLVKIIRRARITFTPAHPANRRADSTSIRRDFGRHLDFSGKIAHMGLANVACDGI